MKKLISFLILVMLLSISTIDVMGMGDNRPDRNRWSNRNHNRNNNNNGGSQGSVGAPLDGGLLAALGIAGVAYVAARKKKKDSK